MITISYRQARAILTAAAVMGGSTLLGGCFATVQNVSDDSGRLVSTDITEGIGGASATIVHAQSTSTTEVSDCRGTPLLATAQQQRLPISPNAPVYFKGVAERNCQLVHVETTATNADVPLGGPSVTGDVGGIVAAGVNGGLGVVAARATKAPNIDLSNQQQQSSVNDNINKNVNNNKNVNVNKNVNINKNKIVEEKQPKAPTCPKGEHYDSKTGKCCL